MVKIIVFSVIGIILAVGIWFGLTFFGILGGGGKAQQQEQAAREESAFELGESKSLDLDEAQYANLSDEMREAIGRKMDHEGFLYFYGRRCLMKLKVPQEIGQQRTKEYLDAYMREVRDHCDNDDEKTFAERSFLAAQERADAQFGRDGGDGCPRAFESLAATAGGIGLDESIWAQALSKMR